jgi:hypothetical protein
MIDQALTFLRDELAAYILARTNSNNVEVKLSKLVNEAGKYAFGEETIALSVVHLEEDRTFKSQLPEYTYVNGQNVRLEPELKFNVHLMIAANFTVYAQAWKAISLVLAFFQSHSSFSSQEYPGLNPLFDKINIELASLTYEQQNQIWGYIGGKYLPSVLYRIRLVVIQDDAISGISKPITEIKTDLRTK